MAPAAGARVTAFVRGQTGVIVPVAEAEPVVGPHRRTLDPAARYGVPAHVTLLFPFLAQDAIDTAALAEVGDIIAGTPAFDVTFARCTRFPGDDVVLYLEPEPDAPFRALTAALWRRWPEAPPYEGQFDDPVPHLTVADGVDAATADRVGAEVSAHLPLSARATEARLVAFDGHRWLTATTFPFG